MTFNVLPFCSLFRGPHLGSLADQGINFRSRLAEANLQGFAGNLPEVLDMGSFWIFSSVFMD
jgi:hypothetical protein